MVQNYRWRLNLLYSSPEKMQYAIETPNKKIIFTDRVGDDQFIMLTVYDNRDINKFSEAEVHRFHLKGCTPMKAVNKAEKKLKNWLPVIRRSDGLAEKAKQELCDFLERL